MSALTPFDTGDRLEPHSWPVGGDPDCFGRVDFDDDASATVLTAYAERRADGSHALHVDLLVGDDNTAVFVDGVRWAPLNSSKAGTPT